MPLPTPQSNQSKEDFISSCMGNSTMMGEYPEDDQRLAVCNSQWGNRQAGNLQRSYSWLNLRAVDEDKRIIEGIATTPVQARDGDILETKGIQFKLPIPLLYRHMEPFGNVISAKVSEDGIAIRAQIAAQGISGKIDEYWRLVKSGTMRGLSIAWRTLQEAYDKEIGGYRIMKSEWLELSVVPVPADPNAMISSVRSADEAILAALGHENSRLKGRTPQKLPGASGSPIKRGVHMKSYQKQIHDLETTLSANRERMTELMDATNDGTLSQDDGKEYDDLMAGNSEIEIKLKRLRALEVEQAPKARAIKQIVDEPAPMRDPRIEVKGPVLEKGTRMARLTIALVRARGSYLEASNLAKEYYPDTPEISQALRAMGSRAFVEAGDTTTTGFAPELIPQYQQLASEFIELLRPATIIGRIPNLRRVPFNVAVPLQTGGGTYNWVGEHAGKPVTAAAFDRVTLRWAKAAGIIVITDELARFSSPSAEAIIRQEMIEGCARFLDTQFVTPTVAAVTNVSPASITNGISATTPSGTTAEDFRYDLSVLMGNFIANNQNPATAVLLMSSTIAMGLSLMVNALGQPEFPNITTSGGTISGLPVVVSENVGTNVILLNARDVLFADDGGFTIDMSREASVEMSDAPLAGESSPVTNAVLKSLWQNNLVGLRVERYITWLRARTSAVEYLASAAYAPSPSSP